MDSPLLRSRDRSFNSRVLKPVLRAYALGYVTTTGPRLVSFLRVVRRKNLTNEDKAKHLLRILGTAFRWSRFPTFCALLITGSRLFEILLERISNSRATSRLSQLLASPTSVKFLATLLSAWLCFPLLNRKNHNSNRPESHLSTKQHQQKQQLHGKNNHNRHISTETNDPRSLEPHIVGRTLDLTLFAVIRALDVLACASWARWKHHRRSKGKWTRLESAMPKFLDTGVFAASSAIVMWAWFYLPERLPYSYGRWISEAAQVDNRLIETLRTARRDEWRYGQPSPREPPLVSMCTDYGLPRIWGDPEKTIPFPCEIVHMGCGPSCEKHALWRFGKAFRFACTRYLPLQLILKWRSHTPSAFLNTIKTSFRSSAFLGLFVSIFYYSVCLARTRLGPKIFSRSTVTPLMWDSGLCVAAGCVMCGWSIFVESARRRQEIALFVAPRAAATVLPRRYERKFLWREQVAFSLSTAIVLTSMQQRPELVRGMLGRVLGRVLNQYGTSFRGRCFTPS